MESPRCQRCHGTRTQYYRHTFPGGCHVGVHCHECRARALTDRTWYPRSLFSDEAFAALPDLDAVQRTPDTRQMQISLLTNNGDKP